MIYTDYVKKVRVEMKIVVLSLAVTALVLSLIISAKPKYIYPVRENIHNNGQVMTWDQYCWKEYANGRIVKKFLGSYRFEATITNDSKFTFSQCSK